MNSQSRIPQILVVLLQALFFSACQPSSDSKFESHTPPLQGRPSELQLQERRFALCSQTLEHIRHDLAQLKDQYPELSGIERAKINALRHTDPLKQDSFAITMSLKYEKNTHFEKAEPNELGQVPKVAGWTRIEPGGINFYVYIRERPILVPARKRYGLGPKSGYMHLRLYYYDEEHEENINLSNAIAVVLEQNATALQNELSKLDSIELKSDD